MAGGVTNLDIEQRERDKLFRQVRHILGAPIRKIELTDEMLCTLLEIAIEDQSSYINNWLIEHQWSSLLGQDVNNADLTVALTTRSLDKETEYTYAYSKIVGLQAGGPWELKKDYITVEKGKQVYSIPAGREINEVLFLTPPTIDHALYTNYGFGDYGFGGGFGQVPFGGGNGGAGGFYLAPAFDIALRDADYNLKQRMISSELVYKITAGPNGTKLLHLIPPPGSRIVFGGAGGVGSGNDMTIDGSKVWYHYYDTTFGDNSGEDNAEVDEEKKRNCLNANKDIIKYPTDVPLDVIQYSDLNTASKQWVREYLTALAKETLGRVRGKFGGSLGVTDSEVTMDYDSLLSEAQADKTRLIERLTTTLTSFSPNSQLEQSGNHAEQLNRSLRYRALPHPIIII